MSRRNDVRALMREAQLTRRRAALSFQRTLMLKHELFLSLQRLRAAADEAARNRAEAECLHKRLRVALSNCHSIRRLPV